MSVLSKVRTYLKNQISTVDSNLVEWPHPFTVETLPDSMFDTAYWITYQVSGSEESQIYFMESISVQMQFCFHSFNDQVADFDAAMNKVNSIKLEAISKTNIEAFRATDNYPIQRVIPVSQVSIETVDNEKKIIIELNLEIQLAQTSC